MTKTILRLAAVLYWLFSYFVFLLTFAYLVGFIGNRYTPNSVDSGVQIPTREAALRNLLLLPLFALQHSGMARDGFKRWIPRAFERSTYLLATCLVLIVIFIKWEPMPDFVWRVDNPAGWWGLQALFLTGWTLVIVASFSMYHFEKFGGWRVWAYWTGKPEPVARFRTAGPYRWIRHPMMLGLLLGFWATPEMSQGHLLFSAVMTLYILLGIKLEERALVRAFGEAYRHYQRHVAMLIPRIL